MHELLRWATYFILNQHATRGHKTPLMVATCYLSHIIRTLSDEEETNGMCKFVFREALYPSPAAPAPKVGPHTIGAGGTSAH